MEIFISSTLTHARVIITIYRVSSFVWKVEWSPQYRPPMIIGICSLLVAISLAFGKDDHLFQVWQYALRFKKKVIRTMLVRENRRMDHEDSVLNEAKRGRIEQAAKLEGITMAEAMEKQRGFRYLY